MKKLFVFTLIGVMVLGLTACGGGDVNYDVDIDDYEYDEDNDYNEYDAEDQGGSETSEYSETGDEGQYGSDAASVYYDTWQADYDYNTYYKFDELGTWYKWNTKENINESGSYELIDGYLNLYDYEGNEVHHLYGDDANTLVDEDGGFIHRYDPANDPAPNYGDPLENADYGLDWDNDGPLSDIVDTWVYMGYYDTDKKDDTTYIFEEDGSYRHQDFEGNVMDYGTYEIDANGDYYETDLYLNADDGSQYTFRIMYSGDYFIEDSEHYYLFRVKYLP